MFPVAETHKSSEFSIKNEYADRIESILASKDVSEKDKQVALTRFYMTILDETTIAMNLEGEKVKGGLSQEPSYSDKVNGQDRGDWAVLDIFFKIIVTEPQSGQVFSIYDGSGAQDSGMDSLPVTERVVDRLITDGQQELLPTLP
jgi:hypothetical protein